MLHHEGLEEKQFAPQCLSVVALEPPSVLVEGSEFIQLSAGNEFLSQGCG